MIAAPTKSASMRSNGCGFEILFAGSTGLSRRVSDALEQSLSWGVGVNAVEIEEAVSELASVAFDAGEFPFAFLTAFGNKAVTVQRLRAGSGNASDIEGGVLQRNNIHIAVCESMAWCERNARPRYANSAKTAVS